MGWSLFRVPQSLTGDPKATCAVRDRGAQEFSKRRSQSFPSLLGVESSDDGAAAPHPAGGGEGSCDPPTGSADGCACRADRPTRSILDQLRRMSCVIHVIITMDLPPAHVTARHQRLQRTPKPPQGSRAPCPWARPPSTPCARPGAAQAASPAAPRRDPRPESPKSDVTPESVRQIDPNGHFHCRKL